MLRIVFIFVIFGYITCNGDTSQNDWKNQGFYRLRRNFPSPSQNQTSFQSSHSQNTQNQYASYNNQNFRNQLTSNTANHQNTNAYETNGQSAKNQNIFGAASFIQSPQIQNQYGASFSQNSQRQNSFGASNSQNNFKTGYSSNYQSQNPFNAINSQDSFISSQNQNSTASYPKPHSYTFENSQDLQRQNPFTSSFGHNAYQFLNFSSNRQVPISGSSFGSSVRKPFKAPEYLPPRKPFIAPGYLPALENPTTSTTKRPFSTTTTKRVYYTTTTRRPFSTTTTTRRPIYTTTTRRPFNATTTTRKYFTTTTPSAIGTGEIKVAPAMAMLVPPEDDPTTTTTIRPFRQSSEFFPEFTTVKVGIPAPAMASLVPPEPEDDPTTTTTRTVTTSTTRLTTPTTTVKTTTPSTTITTQSSTTTTPPPPPPPPTTTTTPSTTTTTTTSTTTTTTPSTTTTSTPPPTMPTTTPELNRYLIEEEPRTTTPATTTTFKAPEYLPPKLPPGPAPAMAIPVPPECDPSDPSTYPPGADQRSDDPCIPPKITTTTPPTTTTTAPSTTTSTPTTTSIKIPFKALEYLPPRDGLPPAPAMAMPVPPEPECDLPDPTYPGIELRSLCPRTTMKPPACLPPASKKRIARSSKTLRLDDVKGARPVWHVGIYDKTSTPYRPICGGSVVSMGVVISAAHCFWEDDTGLQPAENYAVGANKIYRPWADSMDKRVQKSDVKEITIPPRFRGVKASFQDDLAVLKLVTPFKYAKGLRPVCVDFDDGFDRNQLKEGNSGTIAGWGYTDAVGSQTSRLLWLELPYVEIERCIAGADQAFLKYITSDKVCAGENMTGKALCKGDSGGGLVFWDGEPDSATPFLRAIASTAPSAENLECNVQAVGTFTEITSHRRFLKEHIPGIGDECHYKDY